MKNVSVIAPSFPLPAISAPSPLKPATRSDEPQRDVGGEKPITPGRFVVFPPRKILVVDHNTDGAAQLARTLHRDFPQAEVQLSHHTETAVNVLATDAVDAVVLHRTADHDGVSLIRILRGITDVPIIAACGVDQCEQILAAGVTAVVDYGTFRPGVRRVRLKRAATPSTRAGRNLQPA